MANSQSTNNLKSEVFLASSNIDFTSCPIKLVQKAVLLLRCCDRPSEREREREGTFFSLQRRNEFPPWKPPPPPLLHVVSGRAGERMICTISSDKIKRRLKHKNGRCVGEVKGWRRRAPHACISPPAGSMGQIERAEEEEEEAGSQTQTARIPPPTDNAVLHRGNGAVCRHHRGGVGWKGGGEPGFPDATHRCA